MAAFLMVEEDLQAAGIPYKDSAGRFFGFHALRHQFISSLAAAGVHPKVTQTLARHSDMRLTMNVYTHMGLVDVAGDLDKPPAGTKAKWEKPIQALGTVSLGVCWH